MTTVAGVGVDIAADTTPLPFAELDRRATTIGELVLRRRHDPGLAADVFEVKLGDEFLMSSLFTVAEEALARLALDRCPFDHVDVVVGGLGLGYTAAAALDDGRVRSLTVVEALDAVMAWHRAGLVPLGERLTADSRTALVHGDFFRFVREGTPFSVDRPARPHVVLVDIDHTPRHHLDSSHRDFYFHDGLQRLAARLHPGGIFGLWSDAGPDDEFLGVLGRVFDDVTAEIVEFPHPVTAAACANTVYLATAASRSD